MDLRWRLQRRGKPVQAAGFTNRSRRSRPLSEFRMDLAEQHAHSLQPGVLRSKWQTVSGFGADRVVGRKSKTVDGPRYTRCSSFDRWTEYSEWSTRLPLESGG